MTLGRTQWAVMAALILSTSALAQTPLERGFDDPPADAKPGTWYHVMSGNMTREGITLDLEAMARVGIGHVTMFHVTQGIPLGRVKFASPEHIALVAHAAAEAKRLGITFGIHNTDGWTSSGGPWITPEQSMKRVVWSETVMKGGRVSAKLPTPPHMLGYYRDIAAIAFPASPGDKADQALAMTITATGKAFDPAIVTDRLHDAATMVALDGAEAALTLDLGTPTAIAHADMLLGGWSGTKVTVSGSDDGKTWRPVAEMVKSRSGKNEATATGNWNPVTARYFRISSPAEFPVIELRLSATQRIPDFHALNALSNYKSPEETGFDAAAKAKLAAADALPAIDPARIIDLSTFLKPDGTLSATLPKGDWTILRTGYTSTGAVNVPASPEGTGLEVDKFSKTAVEAHYNAYMRKVVDAARAVRPDAFDRTIIDSYEVGGQNWTPGYEALFREATGKDILRYLPVYAGRVVSSAQESDRVLDTIRALNSKLMVDNYFGHFTKLAHQDKLKVYMEAYGFGPFSDIDAAKHADIPMGEFWLGRTAEQMRAMISAGHIYGRQQIAAEAFTAQQGLNWAFHPGMAKTRGDDAWTKGINAFVFHRFAHQANTHVKPGMTMNRWGSHFDRHQPWWDSAGKAWFQYMARGQFLLQQGHAVADIAYFVGDDAPVGCPNFNKQELQLPAGYKADCINPDVLIGRSRIAEGRLMLPEGNGYRALVLAQSPKIAPATLARLEAAAAQGVLIFGAKPAPMPPLGATAVDESALQGQIDRLWARPEVAAITTMPARLAATLPPDFVSDGAKPLPFIHRKTEAGDVYFTYNADSAPRTATVSLRGIGKAPELWDPVTGKRTPVEQFSFDGQRTLLRLPLEAGQSTFIVLTKTAEASPPSSRRAKVATETLAMPVNWSLRLAEATGGTVTLPAGPLVDLKDHSDARARDFAGVATYGATMKLTPAKLRAAKRIWLDLGQVAVSATVRINGREIATSWMPPHRIDITSAVQAGDNRIDIDVATLWTNRLVADAAYPDTTGFVVADKNNKPTTPMVQWYMDNVPPPQNARKSFATQHFFKPTDPRVSAGLIGPVNIVIEK